MKKSGLLLLTGLILAASQSFAQSTFIQAQKQQEMLVAGQNAYNNRCSGCHGIAGDGKGSGAKMLDPLPRDFTKGVFKFKSTPIGAMPTDADLLRVLDNGIPGTSMPSFALVNPQEKRAILEYVKTFSAANWKRQSDELVVPALKMPSGVFTDKAAFLASAKRGRLWFQELGCVSCHGVTGQGNGPSASTLKDVWGHAISPANLTARYVKRGWRAQDVAYSIANGVDGTPMPANADVLQSLESQFPELKDKSFVWDLTAFVFYLRGQAVGIYKNELAPIPETGIPQDEVMQTLGQYFQ